MNKLQIARLVVSNVVGLTAGGVIHSIIKNNTAPETMQEKATVIVGSWVLGSMVGEIASRYMDAKTEKIFVMLEENFKK